MLLLLFLLSCFNSSFAAGESIAGANPFTPKAYLIRYWNKQIRNDLPKPSFLLSMASPLNAVDTAAFGKLAALNKLSSHLPAFCSAANLLCFPDLNSDLKKHDSDLKFTSYSGKNFTNYGTDRRGGVDSFKNYSDEVNVQTDSFRRYSRDSAGHHDEFTSYATQSNVVDQSFNTYGTGASGGGGDFSSYNNRLNVPHLRFNSYAAEGIGRDNAFTTYTENANSGSETFMSYGKNANGAPNEFANYAKGTNLIGSDFNGYGETGNGANDKFTNYGFDGNAPENNFKNYGAGGNGAIDSFENYRDQANTGDDSFQSYAKKSNSGKVNFVNYGNTFNEGTDKFTGYGKGADGLTVGFKIYGVNTTFKDYAKNGVSFGEYTNRSSEKFVESAASGIVVNKWVEPGKFFRESMLKEGNVMPMPDIRDKMPKRSFLPRSISSKLPFAISKISEMKEIFHASDNSSLESMFMAALSDCERSPSVGEAKRCAVSVEDMIDFATSVLGRDVVVRTTENVNGSGHEIMIGSVRGINGGKVTKSVSCHQSLFPYLLYYCHSVPRVRVYEADILDPTSEAKINHGVAICHIDTSAWSARHGAFVALGSGPGRIEVCHWIFENDMTWAIAD